MAKTRSRKTHTSTNALSEAVTIARGDHLIALYATDNERLLLAVPFLLDGLRDGSVCFLIGPESSTKGIRSELEMNRPETAAEFAEGRLIVTEHQDTPRGQYKFFQDGMTSAEQLGVHTFRLFADMIGARERMSIEQVLEIESGFDDEIVHKHPMTAMCAYDVRRFSGVEVLAALKTHRGSVRYAADAPRGKAAK